MTQEELLKKAYVLPDFSYEEIIRKYIELKRQDKYVNILYLQKDNKMNPHYKNLVNVLDNFETYNNNLVIVNRLLEKIPSLWLLSHSDIQNNIDTILNFTDDGKRIYPYLKEEFKQNREVIKATLRKSAHLLSNEWYTKNYKDDKELVLIVVENYPHMFKNVSDRLKNDVDVLYAAIKKNSQNLLYAPKQYLHNAQLVVLALSESSESSLMEIYYELPKKVRENKNILLNSLKNNINTIKIFPQELQEDKEVKEILLNAIKLNPLIIKNFSSYLRNDKEIILEMLSNQENIDYIYSNPLSYIGHDLSKQLHEICYPNKSYYVRDEEKRKDFAEALNKLLLNEKLREKLNNELSTSQHIKKHKL